MQMPPLEPWFLVHHCPYAVKDEDLEDIRRVDKKIGNLGENGNPSVWGISKVVLQWDMVKGPLCVKKCPMRYKPLSVHLKALISMPGGKAGLWNKWSREVKSETSPGLLLSRSQKCKGVRKCRRHNGRSGFSSTPEQKINSMGQNS